MWCNVATATGCSGDPGTAALRLLFVQSEALAGCNSKVCDGKLQHRDEAQEGLHVLHMPSGTVSVQMAFRFSLMSTEQE